MAHGKRSTAAKPQRRASAEAGEGSRLILALGCVAIGTGLCAVSAQSILNSSIASDGLLSTGLWQRLVEALGGQLVPQTGGGAEGDVPFGRLFLILAIVSLAAWVGGAWWISRRQGAGFAEAAARWGSRGWLWWIIGGSWELARVVAYLTGFDALQGLVLSAAIFWIAVGSAGWLATFVTLADRVATSPRTVERRDALNLPPAVWLCMGGYVIAFVGMNWQLYRGLLLAHGDSAMYEEHLWNFLHGKGFRSYLDQGLFLGEHIQVIHLLLIPLYVLWPSQMMLELCDSVLLAAGAIPVYWIARRHTGDSRAAAWLAAAYLLYFPLQFLDIGIDLKTFRPNGLGIPALLFALDQLERRRYATFCLLLAVTLSAQEDFAIILAPLGVWIALRQGKVAFPEQEAAGPSVGGHGGDELPAQQQSTASWSTRKTFFFGMCLAVFSVVYVFVATRVVMAWFRNWQEIHYAGYFTRFGKSLPEIARNMLTRPSLFGDALFTTHTASYALLLLAPVGFLSIFSPGRLAVAVPLFVTLCLNEVLTSPRHHVHAAAIPVIFWAAAAGLAVAARVWRPLWRRLGFSPMGADVCGDERLLPQQQSSGRWWARFACFAALVTGAAFGISPLSRSFWDPNSAFYWRTLYVPGKRAELFPRVLAEIPDWQSARIASTDFVHPRFTHCPRSYDYSDYPRAVNNYKPGVPNDTDYIVIDTQHPYSKIKRPNQVPEYRDHPDQWELLPDTTDGYFIVLKRIRRPAATHTTPTISKSTS